MPDVGRVCRAAGSTGLYHKVQYINYVLLRCLDSDDLDATLRASLEDGRRSSGAKCCRDMRADGRY